MNEFDTLKKRLKESVKHLSDFVVSGGPVDYVEYVKNTAKIEALNIAIYEIERLEKQYIED